MARRPHYTEAVQTRLTKQDYDALINSFDGENLTESEMARTVIVEWLDLRKKYSR